MMSKKTIVRAVRYLVIIVIGLAFLIPFAWMLVSSLKNPTRVFTNPVEWFPDELHFENYVRLFTQYEFHTYVWNTLKLCGLNIIGTVLSCSVVAYGFAFGRYRHKNKIFNILLATMILPTTVTFFPQFILYTKLGWYGTLLPLWVPAFLGNAYYIFFLRQYFLTIPQDMLDAAKLDGCGALKILRYVVVPMARPVYIVMIMGTFITVWGDLFNQVIYILDNSQDTISIGLTMLNSSYGHTTNSTLPSLMGGAFVISIPVLLFYYLGQKAMMKTYVFRETGR